MNNIYLCYKCQENKKEEEMEVAMKAILKYRKGIA
jgi:hypothetical protein